MTDMFIEASLLNITKPDSPEFMQIITQMKKDARFILGFELIYVIINSIFVLLTITATILTAAITYAGKDELSLKDLVFRTWKTWLRPLVTWLYTSLFGLIFFFILGAILVFVSLWTKNNPSKIIYYGAPLVIIAMVYYMYLSVNWVLGIVVSAIEKKRGIEAIRKAGEMIKGMKKQGFMLNVLINVVVGVLQFGFQMMPVKSSGFVVAKGVVVVCLSSLVSMFCFGGYVVIYYMCKKNHGERVELEGGDFSSGYVKVPTTPPVVDEKLP
ncbi:hypothetical protein M5689_023234 [Euphorbia peplus]|nr:hypothetical protein M5689_023234 [Euphorbia peplus]